MNVIYHYVPIHMLSDRPTRRGRFEHFAGCYWLHVPEQGLVFAKTPAKPGVTP